METRETITLVTFRDEFAGDFVRLNRDWLVLGSFLEPADEVYLAAPREKIVDIGGEVFFALLGGDVVGTAAAIPHSADVFELGKLSVAPEVQGRGLGRQLTEAVIAFARERHAARVVLTSSTRLTAAVSLYKSLGFEERDCPAGFGYETADVYMELSL